MKKTLLIALLLIPFIGFSQTTKSIDSFLGIKFGSSKATVTAALKARGGKIDKASNANNLAFDNIKFGHRLTDFIVIRFVNDKAFEADLTFKPEDDNHVIEYYDSLVSDISDVYGKGDVTKKFSSGFADGDGHEIGALLIGAAEYNTIWTDAKNNAIDATIVKDENDLEVQLTYQDDALTALAVAQQKAKDKGDY
jgi:hypothetical protein